MGIKGTFFKGLLIALSLALIPVTAVSAQKITPGTACKTVNQKTTYLKKTYTCVKSGKKLVWNKRMIDVYGKGNPHFGSQTRLILSQNY